MDPLDRMADPAKDLFGRVDDVLAVAGAPAEHRLWPLLRRVGVLPGDIVDAFVAMRAAPLEAEAARVRVSAGGYDDARSALHAVSWEGAGGLAYEHARDALAAHLVDGPDSLAGRLAAVARYLDAVADWVERSRRALARTLADAMSSAEAVAVVTAGAAGPGPTAAAELGARVLAVAAEAGDDAEALLRRWEPELARVALRAPVVVSSRLDGTTRIGG
jgi:hypothetical protein